MRGDPRQSIPRQQKATANPRWFFVAYNALPFSSPLEKERGSYFVGDGAVAAGG